MPMVPIMRPPVMPDMMGVLCSCRAQRKKQMSSRVRQQVDQQPTCC